MRRLSLLLVLFLALTAVAGCQFLWLSPGLVVGVNTGDPSAHPAPHAKDTTVVNVQSPARAHPPAPPYRVRPNSR